MKKLHNGDMLSHETLNNIVKEIEHRMSSGDLIKMYESMIRELYTGRELREFETGRVKEIEFIISYLKAEEIANEFQDEDRETKQH